jgi:hypothetical protein
MSAAQRRPAGGQFRLRTGGCQQPQQVVEQPFVGADDQWTGGRA